MYRICKTVRFEAAHILRKKDTTGEENDRIFGKCSTLHEHSYKVDVNIRGTLPVNGMILNFSELKDTMKEVITDMYDHKVLNNVMGSIPTAENIACDIFHDLAGALKAYENKVVLCYLLVFGNHAQILLRYISFFDFFLSNL